METLCFKISFLDVLNYYFELFGVTSNFDSEIVNSLQIHEKIDCCLLSALVVT